EERLDAVRQRRGERGIWQRRFWEHLIRDEDDYARHVEYCYINPVKHGLVTRVSEWPHSSFHRDVAAGIFQRTGAAILICQVNSANAQSVKADGGIRFAIPPYENWSQAGRVAVS